MHSFLAEHTMSKSVALVTALLSAGFLFADDSEAWFEAARKGDVATIQALLARKAVDVDAKWRYDTTALMMAARRGHTDVVRVLLENGARPNVKDSFYGMTPLSSAASEGRIEIVRMLLEKGAEGKDGVLQMAVGSNNLELVKLLLAGGGLKPETLSAALGAALRNNRTPIADALKAAGAVPGPQPTFEVDAGTLRRYAGRYRAADGNELVFEVRDGKLFGGPPGQALALGALDAVTFMPLQFESVRVVFEVSGDKVERLTFKQGSASQTLTRVEEKP
jgi:hypothetical protein